MLTGSCHCGAVAWRYDGDPGSATACNCSICRRYGALWIYGWEGSVVNISGPTTTYSRGASIDFHFCATCGCPAYYRAREAEDDGRRKVAANLRMAETAAAISDLPIRHFDGLDSFDDLPGDHRRLKDMWF